jgi:membrane-bound ClpP family serine protease
MKQSLLFGFFLITLMSCHKKQYATFQNGFPTDYSHNLKKTEVKKTDVTVENEEIVLPAAPAENVSAKNETAPNVETEKAIIAEKPALDVTEPLKLDLTGKKKMTLIEKVKAIRQLNKLSKYVSKKSATSTGSNKSKSNSDDTLAVISLILGLVGIVALLLGGWIGILVGLAAMITGIISLRSTSKRILAVIGIVLGAALLLLGIIVVVFLATLLSNL